MRHAQGKAATRVLLLNLGARVPSNDSARDACAGGVGYKTNVQQWSTIAATPSPALDMDLRARRRHQRQQQVGKRPGRASAQLHVTTWWKLHVTEDFTWRRRPVQVLDCTSVLCGKLHAGTCTRREEDSIGADAR